MASKKVGFLWVCAALAFGGLAAAGQAAEPHDGAGFLNAGRPLGSGSLVATRAGIGAGDAGDLNDEERRRLADQPNGRVSGTITPITRTRTLPSTRTASRTADIKLSPSFVSAVRNELGRLGLK